MLTRLEVDGFKNLDRIDVRLGPFTCIAGPNGVGKSNLFDAISFLAALAGRPRVEAASTVRRRGIPARRRVEPLPPRGRSRRRTNSARISLQRGMPVRQEPGRKFAWSVVVERDGSLAAAR